MDDGVFRRGLFPGNQQQLLGRREIAVLDVQKCQGNIGFRLGWVQADRLRIRIPGVFVPFLLRVHTAEGQQVVVIHFKVGGLAQHGEREADIPHILGAMRHGAVQFQPRFEGKGTAIVFHRLGVHPLFQVQRCQEEIRFVGLAVLFEHCTVLFPGEFKKFALFIRFPQRKARRFPPRVQRDGFLVEIYGFFECSSAKIDIAYRDKNGIRTFLSGLIFHGPCVRVKSTIVFLSANVIRRQPEIELQPFLPIADL
jgi:hypothetical protein